MSLALTALLMRFGATRETPTEKPTKVDAPRPKQVQAPSRCFEVLVPYVDSRESASKGIASDARHTLLVNVWAPDVAKALACAVERFHDHRRTHNRAAKLATEGPIALRIVHELEDACVLQ